MADDEVEAPYALAVDPKTQDVRVTPYGVCGSNDPWSKPLEGIVEDNMGSLICVQPEGNKTRS